MPDLTGSLLLLHRLCTATTGHYSVRHLIHWSAVLGLTRPRVFHVNAGFDLVLDPRDYLQRDLLVHGEWDVEMAALLRRFLGPGSLFLDIGANIGYFSLIAFSLGSRVVAVEPSPLTYGAMLRNFELNAARDILGVNAACSERHAKLPLYINKAGNCGKDSLSPQNAGSVSSVTVETVPADELVGPNQPALVKIDVEGAEMQVLKGMTRMLERGTVVCMEADDRLLRTFKTSLSDIIAFMKQFGYSSTAMSQRNVLFSRAEAARVLAPVSLGAPR